MTERVEVMWCTLCGARFTDEEVVHATMNTGCPKCGDKGVPCATARDVNIDINWHELHILCVWAEGWYNERCKKESGPVVAAIARRLQQQHPNLNQLTLTGEIAMLPQELTDAGVTFTKVTTNVPPPPLIPINGPGAICSDTRLWPKRVKADREILLSMMDAVLNTEAYTEEARNQLADNLARRLHEEGYTIVSTHGNRSAA